MLSACIPAGRVCAQDVEQRIRRLEDQLRDITRELDELKQQLRSEDQAARETAPRATPEDQTIAKDVVRAPEQQQARQGVQGRLADGLILEDSDERWRLRLTGRVLADYRAFRPEEVASDTFGVRQARLGVTVTVMRDWSLYVEGEYAGSTTTPGVVLANAYVDWQMAPGIRLRAGQFKPLFGLEHTDRVPYFDFTERALPAALIQNFLFDRGVSLMGSPLTGLSYGLSLTNGSGQNIEERQANAVETRQDGKDVTARLTYNLALGQAWRDSIAQFGYSFKSGKQANSTANPYAAASLITEGRGLTFFVPQAFNSTSAPSQVGEIGRRLWGIEAILARGPWKLQGEYLSARYEGERVTAPMGAFEVDMSGYYLSATWMITGESYAEAWRDGIVARIRPGRPFARGEPRSGPGAWELGLRYSSIDASDFNAGNAAFAGRPGTSTLLTAGSPEASAFTVGLKWLPNAYVRYLLNVVRTRFGSEVNVDGRSIGSETAVNVRAQFDLF